MYNTTEFLFEEAALGRFNFSIQELSSLNPRTQQSLLSSIIVHSSSQTQLLSILIFYSQKKGFHCLMNKKDKFGQSPQKILADKFPLIKEELNILFDS